MGLQCYFLNPTDRVARFLRRYVRLGDGWTCADGFHDASIRIEDEPARWAERDDCRVVDNDVTPPMDDERWPTHCACGYEFKQEDAWQLSVHPLYSRSDKGEELTLREAGPGAMWDADWMPWKGPDGRCLVVKLPNGFDWMIDGQANNCTMPDDHMQQRHHCWVRHGEPPLITVDKVGVTCSAGAGSIMAGDYHGFLINGQFT